MPSALEEARETTGTDWPNAGWAVPVFEEPLSRLQRALAENNAIYVSLVDGYRDDTAFYGARAVIEQIPVTNAQEATNAVEMLNRRYKNSSAAHGMAGTNPWYAILISDKPVTPFQKINPPAEID